MIQKGACIGQGRTAEIFAWGDRQVLKLFRAGWPADKVVREAAIARAVYAAGVAVPAVGELVEVDGRAGLIYERIDGPSLDMLLLSRPWLIGRWARQFAEVHVAMHARVAPELPSQRQQLEWKIHAAAPLTPDLRDSALAALARLPTGDVVCHGDFHPGNVLLSVRGPVVIDWENVTHGHPLADVARTSLLLRMGYLHVPPRHRLLIRAGSALFHGLYVRWYARLAHIMWQALSAWRLPVAAARLEEDIREEQAQLVALVAAIGSSNI
jgi:uncharacterized protein (TIGR02172 family)